MGKIKIHKWSSSKVNDRGKTISQYFLLPGDWNLTELYLRWRSCNCFACFILQVLRSKFEIQGRISRLLSGGCGDKKAGTLVERRREDDGGNSGAVDRNEGATDNCTLVLLVPGFMKKFLNEEWSNWYARVRLIDVVNLQKKSNSNFAADCSPVVTTSYCMNINALTQSLLSG